MTADAIKSLREKLSKRNAPKGCALETDVSIAMSRAEFVATLRALTPGLSVSVRTAEGWEQGRPPSKVALAALERLSARLNMKPLGSVE